MCIRDRLYTVLKIDEGSNLGAVRIRIRSLKAAIDERKEHEIHHKSEISDFQRVVFTEQMAKEYTVIIPQMAPMQFDLLETAFREAGYNAVVLPAVDKNAVETGPVSYTHLLSDINSGPLRKAKENIGKFLPSRTFDMRQGSGISVLAPGEADTVIIAGMGGNLIRDILTDDPEKTLRIPRLILQPRNHPELLRIWVRQTPPFTVRQELLAEEDGRLCEIIIAENMELTDSDAEEFRRRADAAERFRECAGVPQDMTRCV